MSRDNRAKRSAEDAPPEQVVVATGLEQRITIRYVVQPMTAEETKSYICHHLGVAGRAEATLFSDDAVARIHDAGRGLPRAVNNLCMQALVATYASKASIVDDKAARVAVSEVSSE